jgi:hypothetical protein
MAPVYEIRNSRGRDLMASVYAIKIAGGAS